MRLVRASTRFLALALVAGTASGCFLGEIDKSAEEAKPASQRIAEAKAKSGDAQAKPGAPKQTAAADPNAPKGGWWATATTLGSEESKADIVACKLNGKIEFMTRDDCLGRSGTID